MPYEDEERLAERVEARLIQGSRREEERFAALVDKRVRMAFVIAVAISVVTAYVFARMLGSGATGRVDTTAEVAALQQSVRTLEGQLARLRDAHDASSAASQRERAQLEQLSREIAALRRALAKKGIAIDLPGDRDEKGQFGYSPGTEGLPK